MPTLAMRGGRKLENIKRVLIFWPVSYSGVAAVHIGCKFEASWN